MTAHWVLTFVKELRERAETLRRYGDERFATITEQHAAEIEQHAAAYDDEELTIQDAARESGYTDANLRRLKKLGQWSGRRRDLPRRPILTAAPPKLVAHGGSIAERVLARQDGRETRRRVGR